MSHPFSGIIVRYCGNSSKTSVMAEGEQTAAPPADQLHVNLWELGDGPVLDVGIMINGWRNVQAIQINLPWSVADQDISDLGTKLNSEKTVAAIFNEVVHYDGSADLSYARVSFRPDDYVGSNPSNEKNTGHFLLLRLSSTAYSTTKLYAADGDVSSQLRINLPELPDVSEDRAYVRFRIRRVPRAVYSEVFRQKDRNLLSSSTETHIVDFRINVRRGVPDDILSGNSEVWFPRFRKIHLFLTIERSLVCEFESQNFIGCRSLVDEDIWNEYVRTQSDRGRKKPDSVRNYLGYQWTASADDQKDGRGAKDLTVLGRFSRTTSNAWYITRFVLLGLIFGMVGNALWDILKPPGTDYWNHLSGQGPSLVAVLLAMLAALLLMFLPLERTRTN